MDMDKAARSISASIRQSSDNISKAQVADGALAVVGDIAQRISELVSQRSNTNLTSTQQGYIDTEITSLVTAAGTVQTNATFNGSASFTSISVTSSNVATALSSIASLRATQGATMNTEEFNIQSYQVNYENTMAARSRIMDADFAEETSRLSRYQILQQAGTAMVSQANAIPQNVLSLLR
jgi:flagellin